MKKAFVIILTILYFGSASGASVNIHYCMGEFSGWNLGRDDAKNCDSCGMEKGGSDDNCCRDEHKVLKVDDVHKSAYALFDFLQLSQSVVTLHPSYASTELISITESYPLINAPPGNLHGNKFILHRSIRI